MGKNVTPVQTLQQLFDRFGLGSASVWDAEIKTICSRNNPNTKAKFAAPWAEECEIGLRERILDYSKKGKDGCGTTTKVEVSKIVDGLRYGSAGVGTAATVSALTLGATAGATVGLGIATAGIGLLAMPIIGIFTQHAQAVAQEQSVACSVTVPFNSQCAAIDEAVASGQVTAEQGIQLMANLTTELKKPLSGIRKDCNLACGMMAYLDAHLDFARVLYPKIAPSKILSFSPGAVNDFAEAAVKTGSGFFQGFAETVKQSGTGLLIAVAVVVGIIFLALGGRK